MSEITLALEHPSLGCGKIIARYDLSEIQEKAYQQGRADERATNKFKTDEDEQELIRAYSEGHEAGRAGERKKTIAEIMDFIKYECCADNSVNKVLEYLEQLKEQI